MKRSFSDAEKIVGSVGLNIAFPYEDLVLIEENPFILRFDDDNNDNMFIHFNEDCHPEDAQRLFDSLNVSAKSNAYTLTKSVSYQMKQKEGEENIDIVFSKSKV